MVVGLYIVYMCDKNVVEEFIWSNNMYVSGKCIRILSSCNVFIEVFVWLLCVGWILYDRIFVKIMFRVI